MSFFYSCLFDGPCLRRGIHNSFISKPKCENLGNIQFLKTNTINQSEFSIQRAGKSARACRDVSSQPLPLIGFEKKWRENFQPITKQYNNQSMIFFLNGPNCT